MCMLIFKPKKIIHEKKLTPSESIPTPPLIKTCFCFFICFRFAHTEIADILRKIMGNKLKCEKINICVCEIWQNYLIWIPQGLEKATGFLSSWSTVSGLAALFWWPRTWIRTRGISPWVRASTLADCEALGSIFCFSVCRMGIERIPSCLFWLWSGRSRIIQGKGWRKPGPLSAWTTSLVIR